MQHDLKPLILEHVNMYLHSAFSPNSELVALTGMATASYTSAREEADRFSHVFVWNIQTERLQAYFQDDPIAEAAFAPMGMTLATVHSNRICLRDPATGEVRQTLLEDLQPDYTEGFWSLAFSPDGSRIAVGMENSDSPVSAYVADLSEGGHVRPLSLSPESVSGERSDSHSVLTCRFLPGSPLLVGTGYVYDAEDCAYLWDLETGSKLLTFSQDTSELDGEQGPQVVLSPNGQLLAAAGGDSTGTASLWQFAEESGAYSWQKRYLFGDPQGAIGLGSFSPDSRTFVAPQLEGPNFTGDAPETSTVALWDMPSGTRRVPVTVPGRCYCLAFAPDSNTLVTLSGQPEGNYWGGAPEDLLHLWDADTGQERAVLRTESRKTNLLFHEPRSARFSPDGTHLVVCHLRHAELWDLTCILDSNTS